ncbi:FMN-binding negative transcriptional regulator [Pseudoxanthomonas wuyuanensis]
MYQPAKFVETDLAGLDWLLARDPFVTLVTSAEGLPFASHLPVLYARDGERVTIEGHWAKPNPQARHGGPALMIVHGPHAYLSPGWYPDKEEAARVPTWNYAAAHLYGRLDATEDSAALAGIVDRLSQINEARIGSDWRFEPDDERFTQQLRGIVGFRFVPDRIELKFKLSQNHPATNVESAAAALQRQSSAQAHEIAELMQDRLARRQVP